MIWTEWNDTTTYLSVGEVEVGGGCRGWSSSEVDGPGLSLLPPLDLRPVALRLGYAVRLVLSNDGQYIRCCGTMYYFILCNELMTSLE